jgi:hypothetical protein
LAKSVVFHIGDPKTGSSSIQQVMHERRWSCPGLTVDYPRQSSAFPVANALAERGGKKKGDKRFALIAAWLNASAADIGVISAEQFARVDPVVLNTAIASHMPDHADSARVIAYVRPHANRFLSAFMQRMKTGVFRDDMEAFFDRSLRQKTLVYTPRFSAWAAVFGPRFTLRPMVTDELRAGDVVSDFLNLVVQGAPFDLPAQVRANESLSLEALAATRELQVILLKNGVPTDTRHAVGSYMGRAVNRLQRSKGTKLGLSPALYQKIAETYRADAEALDLAFFERQPMTRALEAAAAETTDIPMDIRAESHLSASALADLRSQANALARLFQANPKAWRMSYAQERGQVTDSEVTRVRLLGKKKHVDQVQGLLDQVAATATGTDEPKAAVAAIA